QLHDVADVIVEADDYGTQESQLISPDQFRQNFKPHINRVLQFIREKSPKSFIFFHSCGNVRPIIPDFIEMGVDILNPVHISARGMEPVALKKDFGKDITFWGGGVETQNILPNGTPQQVADDVKRNIDALAPGGGFVFNTIHNIQAEVPPENILAMWETLKEYGKY
ncbi:MAG: uroporphyrinogen decarboxylase family protein, partial [Bacteroidota bacterium]